MKGPLTPIINRALGHNMRISLRAGGTVALFAVGTLLAGGGAAQALPVTPAHDYQLNGSLADLQGGPSLTNNGAAFDSGNTGLLFGRNQGPSLSNGIDPSTYSIETFFRFDSTSGYRKILDFKDRSSDAGFYNLDRHLNFYIPPGSINQITSTTTDLQSGTMAHLVMTRDGNTKAVVGYVDGIAAITFKDSSSDATFSASNQIMNFFIDDLVTAGTESSAGFVDFIRTYNQVLTPGQVTQLYNNGAPLSSTPVPGSLLLLGSALASLGVTTMRRFRRSRPRG